MTDPRIEKLARVLIRYSLAVKKNDWVRIDGSVKRPGEYEFRPGMTARDLIEAAEGLWPDALMERAVIDRTSPERQLSSVAFPLDKVLAGEAEPIALQAMDVVHVFGRWDTQNRPQVHITGEVNNPVSLDHRDGNPVPHTHLHTDPASIRNTEAVLSAANAAPDLSYQQLPCHQHADRAHSNCAAYQHPHECRCLWELYLRGRGRNVVLYRLSADFNRVRQLHLRTGRVHLVLDRLPR